jgi:ABC-2 type transport system ATP-binding protein
MIDLKNISFYYNKKQPLFNDLSLNLAEGRIYGLLGKNGAGKTTLLKNIAGLSIVKEGHCTVFGMESKDRKPEMLENIFFLPEEIWLPDVTVSTYLKMYAPSWPDFDYVFFRYCLSEFEIQPKARLKNMSFGQRKKTAISFALATQSKLLILDEPTNGLDIPSKGKFRKLVSEIMNDDRCIILSTHQVRDLETLIDKIIILENSKILLNNTIEQICEKLFFKIVPMIDQQENILYSEFTPRGYSVVTTNPDAEESKLDLETLFNLCTQMPEKIQQLFHQ